MIRYVRRRLMTVIPVFFGITLLVFIFLSIAPGTIADLMGEGGNAISSDQAALEERLGLNDPLPVRYLEWLGNLFHGDLGLSWQTGRPVAESIAQRVGPSLILTGTGVALAILLAIPLGTLAAWKPRSIWNKLASVCSMVSFGVPGFLLSLVLVYIFSLTLGLLPASRMYTTGSSGSFGDLLYHLALPAAVICISNLGELVKQTRAACLETIGEDYIRTAWAKGLKGRVVLVRHVFRGSLTPILTTVLTHIPHIIGGSVVVERLFGWPGMGSLMFTAILSRDYAMVMGVTVVIALTVFSTNLLLDLVYGLVDPRVRQGRGGV
ncbi:peptide ABC transporter permease [Flavonifractor sp. An92]|uniref:ABC transporter permease n=1 Tax=Flavonifractor sp. An92 TaxID=1965666 RepID=UPI000B397BE9|nr:MULTISPECIES: ABC transporter permease [unclassified Flavonifractor]OUN07896.1 peptide ABC transporter permease [Flavonifractor sp. An92]OUQ20653.1 peptide ABC transporter permease [Flavonifractor sp. An135]